ncbi:MAG: phosphoribosylformylglycinamidine synthase subunit PurL [Deltaproteobacteria bacterium]|nr:phosphoribosylformylglycinamidine synthase subunit PurL [Deltaproteobacteria bacterium]
MTITAAELALHGLAPEEFARICTAIGREPNETELGVFSAMWSEHCSYKSSRRFLRRLPTKGPQVLQGPGENAGIIDFGDGWGLVFKMESHNHPSYIEPYQGAATGVGGILRDVFTMGARPIANLNSLRFGAADHPRTRHLVKGVVAGIGGYGNCMGIPTVGGEIAFDPSYNGNILVNAMTVGLVRVDRISRGVAAGVGNPVIYVGSKTGRDGIHGATMASATFGAGNEERRPTVQVGDPFTEKLLLEACLEAFATDAVVGIQDMGAAGLTSSAFEMADRAGTGLSIDLDRVPQRETGMTPCELMLSESQERMLMVVQKGREAEVFRIFAQWELDAVAIGEVTNSGRVVATMGGRAVLDLPVAPVTRDAPVYDRPRARPPWQDNIQRLDCSEIPAPADYAAVLCRLLGSPSIASKRWAYRQYDSMVGTDTVVGPGSDAAVLRVKGLARGVAVSVDCNSRYCYCDPYWGAALAVAEAARNIVCSGGRPVGCTDCLNFGSPEQPPIMWQFEQAVLGMAAAAEAFGTPIVSGNVSLYNENQGEAIHPTPTIGMVGIVEDLAHVRRQWFCAAGDAIVLMGDVGEDLGASAYLAVIHERVAGHPPPIDFDRERAVQRACLTGIRRGLIRSAHDCSEGGIAVALAECAVSREGRAIGARVTLPAKARIDAVCFGESASRIIVTARPDDVDRLIEIARELNCPIQAIGTVGGDRLLINNWIDVPVATLADAWWNGLEKAICAAS